MKIKYFISNKVNGAAIFLFLALFSTILEAAREDGINKIEVFVSSYCYRINNVRGPEILLLKRSPNRQIYPGIWECGGGSVRENENFEDAAKRQLLEEAGITASRWKVIECFETEIRQGTIVPGVAFSCKADSDASVELDPKEHTDFRWLTISELEKFDLVTPKMRKSILRLLMLQDKFL